MRAGSVIFNFNSYHCLPRKSIPAHYLVNLTQSCHSSLSPSFGIRYYLSLVTEVPSLRTSCHFRKQSDQTNASFVDYWVNTKAMIIILTIFRSGSTPLSEMRLYLLRAEQASEPSAENGSQPWKQQNLIYPHSVQSFFTWFRVSICFAQVNFQDQ